MKKYYKKNRKTIIVLFCAMGIFLGGISIGYFSPNQWAILLVYTVVVVTIGYLIDTKGSKKQIIKQEFEIEKPDPNPNFTKFACEYLKEKGLKTDSEKEEVEDHVLHYYSFIKKDYAAKAGYFFTNNVKETLDNVVKAFLLNSITNKENSQNV
jgi:hypothetical protein